MIRLFSAALIALTLALAGTIGATAAVRHHIYVGTITRISAAALTIHSKSRASDYTFQIDQSTRFLVHGQAVSRDRFKVGSYVTVSYSAGSKGAMLAYHVSLRK